MNSLFFFCLFGKNRVIEKKIYFFRCRNKKNFLFKGMNDWTAGKTFPGKKTKILPNVDGKKKQAKHDFISYKKSCSKKMN